MTKTSSPSVMISSPNLIQQNFPGLYYFWKFSRPHTIIGTTLSVLGMYLIAISEFRQFPGFNFSLLALFWSWLACIFGNIYIVGLNQLEDIEIDQINKPNLPLASGEYSKFQAQMIVGITGILALTIAAFQGYYLLGMVTISLLLGTAYSLPPIRLKRFPFWAAFCIFTVRGIIVNLGLYLHLSWILSAKSISSIPIIPPSVWALTLFVLVFTVAIAIFKDIPDLEGDRQFQINTLTIKLGTVTVFNLSLWIITVCYLGMILGSFLLQSSLNPIFLGFSHLILLTVLWWRSQTIDLSDKQSITGFYQFIWKLFFLEYLIFPLSVLTTTISLNLKIV
ncbi:MULTISPECIES: homogentisate phytyltransferase [Planktothrix]|jgi:homogentisate phytyltransferase/homogentisate geranylgeranyltransferase|uniref:UbiA prenyltransferase n=2 Tax=Planktothrix TaxID=54304 RepID=A0A1J1JL72_PLAAG|nr:MULTISPECIES: homogentisate phytyltransferase [Planktothrix]MCF3608081.1 homogentisate phytyltransferase [Planktothrix agardhii 1033]MBG0746362.1 homogentisate phytyltransferase [Planktothrix agardhii KL2]MCB8752164.1 homogentisate phytyltransferase [Planktothrix agardhii 1810]MCB8761210.1 homogentisate phytyltransferase [Planktothrix agardhii 1813]MCB8785374.1 homogentisate phytyltransferase [Planktothrix agardhii 1025]